MNWSVPLVLVLAALAGCTDSEPEPITDGLEATPDTGVIRGLVVDPAIKPLAGVSIALEGEGLSKNTTSDAEGLFGFAGLVPGQYIVRATLPGYTPAQGPVQVVAGDSRPPITKLLLEPDPDQMPYVQAYKYDGFIECSVSAVAAGLAACQYVPDNNDEFMVEYQMEGPPSWVQSEMVWQSSQGVSQELSLLYSRTLPDQVLYDNWQEASGPSPQVIQVDAPGIDEVGLGGNVSVLTIRVFNQHNEGTAPEDHLPDPTDGDDCYDRPVLGGCLRGAGVTVQQTFTIYTHVFYGYTPPAGWLFHETNDVPGP